MAWHSRGGARGSWRCWAGMERAVAGAHLQLVSVRHPKVGRQAEGVELEVTGDAVGRVLVECEPLLHAVRHLGRLEQRTCMRHRERVGYEA